MSEDKTVKQKMQDMIKEEEEAKYKAIGEVIEKYKDREGSLIQVLHSAQNIYGYLPMEIQKYIAVGMGMPLSEVSGVVSFYALFSDQPRAKHDIRVCMGTACYVRGGKKLVDKLEEILNVPVGQTTPDGKFCIEICRCVGACGLAPVIMIEDEVYQQVKPEAIENMLSNY